MRKKTRPTGVISALMVALMLIISASPGKATGQDPNESTWDPADALEAVWTSVEASAMLYNPTQTIQQDPDLTRRAVTISGEIHVLDTSHLIALSTLPTAVATDSQGSSYLSTPNTGRRWYRPVQYTPQIDPNSRQITYGLEPAYVNLQFNVDPETRYPTGLIDVSWDVDAIFAGSTEEVDVPYNFSSDWLQIKFGVRVRVEEATSDGLAYQYRIVAEYDKYNSDATLPMYLIKEIQLIDADLRVIHADPAQTAFQPAAPAARHVTITGSGTCTWGDPRLIRFVVAVLPFEAKVPLTLTDIPVPSLSDPRGTGGR
jgi:hypothetical protein